MKRFTKSMAVAVAALACAASPAWADDDYTTESVTASWTAASAESCTDPDVAPMLATFKDDDLYAIAPGGAFDDGAAGWELQGGAVVDSIASSGLLATGAGALSLPVGASATSPTFCVDERYPHFRFGFAQESAEQDSDVQVDVVYPGLADKNVRKAKDLKAKHGHGWELSDKIKLKPDHGLKHGGWRLVAIRITVKGGKPGTRVLVDDVLVDPKARA
jgi:hypothetical protein